MPTSHTFKDESQIAGIPGRRTPAGAPTWLAELIEHALNTYGNCGSAQWIIARILAGSALSDERQASVRRELVESSTKNIRRARRNGAKAGAR